MRVDGKASPTFLFTFSTVGFFRAMVGVAVSFLGALVTAAGLFSLVIGSLGTAAIDFFEALVACLFLDSPLHPQGVSQTLP